MPRKIARAVELVALGKEFAAVRRRSRAPTDAGKQRIVERLIRLHGLPQKIGQILSLTELRSDAPAFTRLVETPPQLSAARSFAEIDRALGRPWQDCFRSLDPRGVGASLAQVHRGILHDGREVAVKIQYPGIAETLDLDLKALGWLTAPIGGLRRGFDLAGYRREVGEMLRLELDYRHEAEMLRRFRAHVASLENIRVPEVIDGYSGDRILTMTWIEGVPFSEARQWTLEERTHLAGALVTLFFSSIFSAGMVHADPHPGNYRFDRAPKHPAVGLLDFGCVKMLGSTIVAALHALIDDAIDGRLRGSAERARARFESLGFNPLLLEPMQHRLPELCEILFAPLLADRPFDMNAWRLGARAEQSLGEFRWNLRMAGPPALIYFMRAYQGLVQYLSALAAPANWRAAYERAAGSPPEEPCPEASPLVALAAKSRSLRIRVTRSGRTKAELTFPAAAAENLPDLIPPEVEPRLAARHIDVAGISRSLIERGFPPGELFALEEGRDDFRVWLE